MYFLYAIIFAHTAGTVLYFVNTRYKMPVLPFFIIFAAGTIVLMVTSLQERKYRKLFLALLLCVTFLFVSRIPLFTYDLAVAHNNLALIYRQKGWDQKAINEFKKAIRINPEKAPIYLNLGMTYLRLRQFDRAIASFQDGLARNPRLFLLHEYLGLCYASVGKIKQAEKEFHHVLQLNPEREKIIRKYLKKLKAYRNSDG